MAKKICISSVLFLLTFTLSHATNYYVSKSGDNKNKGTSPTNAWASLDTSVYMTVYRPGDTIFFMGGETYPCNIYFDNRFKTSSILRIVITSYGKKRAILNANDSTGIFIYNNAGITISNLNIIGSGSTKNKGSGIFIFSDDSAVHQDILLKELEISGFGQHGILISVKDKADAVFRNITIENVRSHDNLFGGIITSGAFLKPAHYSIEKLLIQYCEAYNNFGNPAYIENHSGNGIVCGSVRDGLIQFCVAHHNGKNNGCINGGPVGIWCWASTEFTIQYCESHHNNTGTIKDGGGFDLDGGVTNSYLQYNYSHDNDGPGFLLCQFYGALEMKNLTVRYNISENDGRKNGAAGILLWSSGSSGGIQNAYIYNNTIYMTPPKKGQSFGILVDSGEMTNIFFLNNIIQTSRGVSLVKTHEKAISQLSFLGNCYWASGDNFSLIWGSKIYDDYTTWQNYSGQERDKLGNNLGLLANPMIKSPGRGVTLNNADLLASLEGYKLRQGSPACDKGINLGQELGIDPGASDFYRNRLVRIKTFSMGAHQACK